MRVWGPMATPGGLMAMPGGLMAMPGDQMATLGGPMATSLVEEDFSLPCKEMSTKREQFYISLWQLGNARGVK
jgi:hypothetical protein